LAIFKLSPEALGRRSFVLRRRGRAMAPTVDGDATEGDGRIGGDCADACMSPQRWGAGKATRTVANQLPRFGTNGFWFDP
jgi:hypothetical protein